eukprot:6297817-Pyramimonas_sp.AAC.1
MFIMVYAPSPYAFGPHPQEGYLMEYLLRNACFDEHEYMSMNAFPATRAPKGQKRNEWMIIRKYWKVRLFTTERFYDPIIETFIHQYGE